MAEQDRKATRVRREAQVLKVIPDLSAELALRVSLGRKVVLDRRVILALPVERVRKV